MNNNQSTMNKMCYETSSFFLPSSACWQGWIEITKARVQRKKSAIEAIHFSPTSITQFLNYLIPQLPNFAITQ